MLVLGKAAGEELNLVDGNDSALLLILVWNSHDSHRNHCVSDQLLHCRTMPTAFLVLACDYLEHVRPVPEDNS